VIQQLGVLKKVDVRVLWQHEAAHFTPWLAQHLGELSEVLGMELELQLHEAPVGPFSLDLLATDLGRDRPVVIENQLEATDHDHLGKLLTYAAGYDAGTVVWIATEIRDQHRQALEWLNQRTDQHTEFFGVVLEAIQIDDSRPAVNFKIVASPNDWQKASGGVTPAEPSERGEAYRLFFQGLIDRLRDDHQFTRARKGQPQNWYSFASGVSGIVIGTTFVLGGRTRVDLYIERGDSAWNKQLFDLLLDRRATIEERFGEPLEWERLDDRKASRIAVYRAGSIADDPVTLQEVQDWMISRALKVKEVLVPAATDAMSLTHSSGHTATIFTPE